MKTFSLTEDTPTEVTRPAREGQITQAAVITAVALGVAVGVGVAVWVLARSRRVATDIDEGGDPLFV
ncbi:tetrahydromethanopterin S-methyltransferase subunit B [Deinobacterium chartae]|uniref:Tetrahydromethanopterin S-methyltransferase subunit B n=1 Tax=Deinobacterium chartae TaxID=521158 RepID=A0A841HUJ6_9DEIO|nr:hypothetical protein [Deinobacterium chartae]MBB6097017.1 tetrahydromethanopterin S-methyltransferase subunit B [Deinobacterium chartae]